MTHPLFQDNEARDALVADSREYIRQKEKSMIENYDVYLRRKEDERQKNKRQLQMLLLEWRISEYNQQQQRAADRAMVQV